MKNVFHIASREFRSYFISPIGWVVLTFFLGIMGYMFSAAVAEFVRRSTTLWQMPHLVGNLNTMIMQPVLGNMAVIFLLVFIPAMTMRLIAEEKRSGTIELLLTSPLSATTIILGKYLASLALFALILLLSLLYPYILWKYGTLDLLQVASGYLGVFLLGAAQLSMGLFLSSLTRSQVIAFISTCGASLFFWIVSWISINPDSVAGKIVNYVSMIEHLGNFLRGLIDTRDIIYFLSFIVLSLFLAHRSLRSYAWR